jgi:hypothetical protein
MGTTRRFRVPVSEIAYVRSIYEAYDGLGTLSSDGAQSGELTLWIAPGQEALADLVEQRLSRDAGLQRI